MSVYTLWQSLHRAMVVPYAHHAGCTCIASLHCQSISVLADSASQMCLCTTACYGLLSQPGQGTGWLLLVCKVLSNKNHGPGGTPTGTSSHSAAGTN